VTSSPHPHVSTTPDEVVPEPAVGLTDAIVLKDRSLFLVCLRDGTVPVGVEHPLGLYRDDCRFLSGHELRIAGAWPRLLVASASAGDQAVHEMTNTDLWLADGTPVPQQTLQIRLERRIVAPDRMAERLHLQLYGRETVAFDAELRLAADFLPMLAIRGIVEREPTDVTVEVTDDGLCFATVRPDGVRRTTTATTRQPCTCGDDGLLSFPIALQPGGHQTLLVDYEVESEEASGPSAGSRMARRPPRVTQVDADDELFKRVVRRSLIDLRMLRSSLDTRDYFAAGVPWFATLFGRDSLITAIQTLAFVPEVAEDTLRLLAARLGREVEPRHEEEPGKVLHELRVGEVAALGATPLARYYGTVDATALFLCLLAEHADWTGSLELFRTLRGEVDAMLGWIQHHGDHDGDGLLDYRASTPDGLRNQGWKDSDDGIMDEHGVPLEPPIALVEPQAYAVRALRGVARLFAIDGDEARAAELRADADARAERLERFWVPGRRFYGMAIDGAGQTSPALGSNQGHVLWASAVPGDRARAIRDALMSEEMFSGWGLRTLGSGEAAFNPVGYHLGTVWPHDTALAAVGLRHYDFDDDFTLLFEGMLEAASHAEGYSLPELFAGFSRAQYEVPVPYPVACHPQAWASGAIPYMLINGLGLHADGLERRLRIRRPSLPRWVNRVEVERLGVAGARIDLVFERTSAGDAVALTDARIDGDVDVLLEINAPP
jgi:glycogen debranching enzyme